MSGIEFNDYNDDYPEVNTAYVPPTVYTPPPVVINPYYVDTISKAGEEFPYVTEIYQTETDYADYSQQSLLDRELDSIQQAIDYELQKSGGVNIEKRNLQILNLMKLWMRRMNKVHIDYISAMDWQIKEQGKVIYNTYNTLPVLSCTVLSVIATFGSAGLSLTPFVPDWMIAKETASILSGASPAFGSLGSGIHNLGSIFNPENKRQVYQIDLHRLQNKQSDSQGSKQRDTETLKSISTTQAELVRTIHSVVDAILNR